MADIPAPCNTITALIDKHMEEQRESPRPHLGASLLGHPCERFLWLSFRWAVREHFTGRELRLFERGRREEAVFVSLLQSVGVVITHTGADQVHVTLAPHVGGSVDGIIESGLPEAPKAKHVVEFKTHNKKSFDELTKKGVYEAKRRHWCQMQCYMAGTGIDRALYLAVCKDDDRLYSERVEFDPKVAKVIIDRGARIAMTERMPPPLSTDASFFQCKMCPCWKFCHDTHLSTEITCRTCSHVTPTKEGTWRCELHGRDMPYEVQVGGCLNHVYHPDLVPWPFKGGDATGTCAVYEIDGRRVLNGCAEGAVLSASLLAGKRDPEPVVDIPF